MRVLIATDAFPPLCGGSGWSTYELANGLRVAGHEVFIIRPRFDTGMSGLRDGESYDGFRPIELHAWAPRVPFVRNYLKNERHYRRFAGILAGFIRSNAIDIVHAQHLLTGPPAIDAGRRAGIPSVCTVRDYWPICYWSDLIHDRAADGLCPACSAAMMTQCVRPHAGALWPAALPLIPYMRANLALKRAALARADAVVAVSSAIAEDLRSRAPELAASRIEIIPNPVNVKAMRTQATGSARPLALEYALYVGKLEPNKGVAKLRLILERSRLDWPLVIVGDGSERKGLEAATRAAGLDVRFVGWRPREDVLQWMQHASLLIFPSFGPESLSRVLLEASALGVPLAAMDTGGTGDIVVHEETGLLSRTAESLGDDIARLRRDEPLRIRLGQGARARIERLFDTKVVVERVVDLYQDLARRHRATAIASR